MPRWRGPVAAALVCAGLAAWPADAGAQMPGRRASPLDQPKVRERESPKAAPAPASEPFSALERELPSLRTDLKLKGAQADAWGIFERDVRSVAEMDRALRRRILALRDAGEKPADAPAFIASLAQEEREKAAQVTDLKGHFEALRSVLDEPQRGMLDRRIIQSQVEPLGR